uniref:Uncharacterized protein n=1 Tax=viral metagenome TaxID=1070528 RepID=A0A6M3XHM1_9ZZZZ
MSETVTLTIGFHVVTDELEKANTMLEEMIKKVSTLQEVRPPAMKVSVEADTTGLNLLQSGLVSSSEKVQSFQAYIKSLENSLNLSADQTKIFYEAISKLPTRPIQAKIALQEIGVGSEEITKLQRGMSQLTTEVTRAQAPVAVNTERWRAFNTAVREFRMTGGVAGYAFQQLAMQTYWLGIGVMFVSMSFARLATAQNRAQDAIGSLARSMRSLQDAQKNLRTTIIEYGAGSEEARNASMDLIDAQEAQRRSTESLRNMMLQEKIAFISFYLGAIPIGINVLRTLWTGYSTYRGLLQEAIIAKTQETAVEVQNTAVKGYNMTVTSQGAAVTTVSTGAKTGEAVATGVSTKATIVDIGVSKAWIAVKAFGIGILTIGIGALVAFAAATAMTAVITAQVDEQMKKATQSSKDFYGSANRLTGGMGSLSYSNIVYGDTLKDTTSAQEDASKEMDRAKESAQDLEDQLGPRSLRGNYLLLLETLGKINEEMNRSPNIKVSSSTNEIKLLISELDNVSRKFLETTQNINKFSIALGPHSVTGAARQARIEMESLTKSMKVPELRSRLEVSPPSLRIERQEVSRPISIYAPMEISVTDRRDIPNISRQIEEGLVRAVRVRGRLE